MGLNENVVGIFVYTVHMYSAKRKSSYVPLLGIINISTALACRVVLEGD